MKTVILLLGLMGPLRPACISVDGDKILVRDLALALPEFAAVDLAQVIGFAPIPGTTRILRSGEIVRLAKSLKVPVEPGTIRDVCFEGAAAVLTEDQIRTAITAAVGLPIVKLNIIDFSRSPVPAGRLELSVNSLVHSSVQSADFPITWRGRLVSESGHSFPVWVKMTLEVKAQAVIAVKELNRGQVLAPSDVGIAEEAFYPLPDGLVTRLEDAIGEELRCGVPAGRPIARPILDHAKEVLQGETVHVDSISGKAHISFDAVAQSAGRKGDLIQIQNPNGRSFQARVVDKGRVEVRSASENANVY